MKKKEESLIDFLKKFFCCDRLRLQHIKGDDDGDNGYCQVVTPEGSKCFIYGVNSVDELKGAEAPNCEPQKLKSGNYSLNLAIDEDEWV